MYLQDEILAKVLNSAFAKEAQDQNYRSNSSLGLGLGLGASAGALGAGIPLYRKLRRVRGKLTRHGKMYTELYKKFNTNRKAYAELKDVFSNFLKARTKVQTAKTTKMPRNWVKIIKKLFK